MANFQEISNTRGCTLQKNKKMLTIEKLKWEGIFIFPNSQFISNFMWSTLTSNFLQVFVGGLELFWQIMMHKMLGNFMLTT